MEENGIGENREEDKQIPFCYGISLFRYLRAGESEEERESIVRQTSKATSIVVLK